MPLLNAMKLKYAISSAVFKHIKRRTQQAPSRESCAPISNCMCQCLPSSSLLICVDECLAI